MFDWYDVWRVALALVCLGALVLLGRRFFKYGPTWNPKTRDLRFSLLMWILTGMTICIQGIWYDLPVTPVLVLVTAATATTWIGLKRKGEWGGRDDGPIVHRDGPVQFARRALRVPRAGR